MKPSDKVIFADVEGDNYLEDLTTMWTIQIAEGVDEKVIVYADQAGYPPISEALKILKKADKIAFHFGLGFDFWAINKLYPDTLKREQIVDTVVMSRLMNSKSNRHSLAELGERVGLAKGEFDDFSAFSEEMAKYGKRDVQILQRAWKGAHQCQSFAKFYDTFLDACETEFYTAYVIAKQEHHGFRFDVDAANELEAELRQEANDITRQLQEVFPPIVHERYSEKTGKRLKDRTEVFNPGSRDQIADRLVNMYGWKPKKKTKTGKAKIDEEILSELPYPEAALVARYLTLGKMLGQIADGDNAWQKLYVEGKDKEVYVHGFVNTIGCRTHRMSHSKPNMAQVNSDPRMRRLWLPDKGDVLVGVDAEGLELRMLAHYLWMYDDGVYSNIVHSGDKKLGTDIHTMNMKAAGLFLRDSAKTMIYAHNYGCFDPKLGMIVIEDAKTAGQPVPKGSPTNLGAALRANIEVGIVGLGKLISKCKKAHAKHNALPGLDGRWIPSASEHSALNTLLQGNGSIVMKVALNEFDKEMERLQLMDKFSYCANVHDEFQLSVHPDYAEQVAKVGKWSITKAGEVLGVRCPLVGSADMGASWAETH